MTMPGVTGWIVQLDPTAVSTNRTMLDINNPSTGIQIGGTSSGQGPDWGISEISEYAAQQSRYGSTVADYVWPNRTITIPIVLGNSAVDPNTALQSLREKVALFQREGGWLRRQRSGALNLYADVVDAQLTVPDAWGEGGHFEPSVTLTLICLPDFYGDEISLDSVAATGVYTGVAAISGVAATILGDHPSRCPVIVTDTSGNNQLSLIWGLRSRYYDSSATAALFYEAEALTPVNGAAVITGVSGASGGKTVAITGLPAANWTSMLVTTITSGTTGNFTHQGSYRVWARCYSNTGTPQFQFLWGVGSLSVPVTNTSVTLPATSGFYLLDLGEVRIDGPPVGTSQWLGAIQAYSAAGGDSASVDCLYLQPLDDGAGQLTYVNVPPSSSIATTAMPPTTGTNVSAAGSGTSWSNPGRITVLDGSAAEAGGVGTGWVSTDYLEATGFGFSVSSAATIVGIVATAYRWATSQPAVDLEVKLVKAGSIQAGGGQDRSSGASWPTVPSGGVQYGGAADLWGNTWTPANINNSGFGVVLRASLYSGYCVAWVDYISVTVYYTFGSGFAIAQDAVIYADQNVHLRHDGMWREAPSGTVYGTVSQVVGDLTRLPPSGLENRPCQIFIKPSRGDLNSLADSGLDGFTVQPQYNPTFIFRP